jgi:hypothetical protein
MTAPEQEPHDQHHSMGPTKFDLWCKYEDMAMHFNDLILRLRFQALAGVAGISAIISVLGKGGSEGSSLTPAALGGVFTLLAVLWVAIWVLDRAYYDKLLTGAVDALCALEQAGDPCGPPERIDISTRIEKRVNGPASEWFSDGRDRFYALVFVALLGGALSHFPSVRSWVTNALGWLLQSAN